MSSITPFDEMNRMFDRMSRNFGGMGFGNVGQFGDLEDLEQWREMRRSGMDVDVAEYDDEIAVVADLPGFATEDIDLTVREGVLTITASRSVESDEGEEDSYVRRERRAESLRRSITLPAEVLDEEASATYSNGVLTVTLPKVHVEEDSDGYHIDVN